MCIVITILEYIECWYYSNYRCMYVYCNNNNMESLYRMLVLF